MKIFCNWIVLIGSAFTLLSSPAFGITEEGHKLVVAGPSKYAVQVAQQVSEMGGNAVDAAVAIGFALGVTNPYFAALGGGGFALVKMSNSPVEALDFREVAPKSYNKDSFLKLDKKASTDGGHAVGVPGMTAGLWALHKRYGKVPWSKLLNLTINLAKNGFRVSGEWVRRTDDEKARFTNKSFYFKKNGESYRPGEILKQPQLAIALTYIKNKNLAGFYDGPVARDLVASVNQAGGLMTLADLKTYQVRWLKPLETKYAGFDIYLMPPPSSGGVVIQTALRLIEDLKVSSEPALSANELHLLGEIQARAYRGRSLLGDPDFHKNPISSLTSEKYLKELKNSIRAQKTTELKPLPENFGTELGAESSETTHFSVMDASGNAVAMTVTLNGNYGSGVVTNKFGIALNNEMDDFTTRPSEPNMFGLIQGAGNVVEPGKRPLSSMSPTLVLKDGKVQMAVGAPGGPRIISAVLQTLYRVLGRGTDLDVAIQAPRVHHQYQPNTLFVDKDRLPPESIKALKDRGHQVQESSLAKVYAVRINAAGNLEAAFDSRGEGAAGGF